MRQQRKGFTLIELLIVIGAIGILFLYLDPSLRQFSGRNPENDRAAYENVVAALNGALRDSMSGWGGLAQDKGVRDDAGLLPERYGLVFVRDGAGPSPESTSYVAVQTQDRDYGGATWRRVIHMERLPYESKFVHLARIVGKNAEDDPGTDVAALAVLFKNPSGVSTFAVSDARAYSTPGGSSVPADQGNTVAEFVPAAPERRWRYYELTFVDDGGKDAFSVTVGGDKRFYVKLK